MWRTSFGGFNDFGVGSAIAVFLFLLVVPVLALNIRRFRRERLMAAAAPETVRNPCSARHGRRQDPARASGSRRCRSSSSCVGLLWLVPTIGLFLTSILPAPSAHDQGLVEDLRPAEPRNLVELQTRSSTTRGLTDALKTTAYIAVGNTLLVVIVGALAGYAFAWLEFPGPRLDLHRRDRPARRAAADGADPDVQALRHSASARRCWDDPLPRRVRAAVRDLPPAQLLHRDPEGHPRVGADRRRAARSGSSCA